MLLRHVQNVLLAENGSVDAATDRNRTLVGLLVSADNDGTLGVM